MWGYITQFLFLQPLLQFLDCNFVVTFHGYQMLVFGYNLYVPTCCYVSQLVLYCSIPYPSLSRRIALLSTEGIPQEWFFLGETSMYPHASYHAPLLVQRDSCRWYGSDLFHSSMVLQLQNQHHFPMVLQLPKTSACFPPFCCTDVAGCKHERSWFSTPFHEQKLSTTPNVVRNAMSTFFPNTLSIMNTLYSFTTLLYGNEHDPTQEV